MFRPCRLRLAPLLRAENTLLVRQGAPAHARDLIPDSGGRGSGSRRIGRSLIRRYQRSYNTSLLNLGETVLGIGIPGSVSLSLYPEARIADVCLVTERLDMDAADVRLLAQAEGDVVGAELELALYIEGAAEPVARAGAPAIAGEVVCNLKVPRPRLWWPAGYGQPHSTGSGAAAAPRERAQPGATGGHPDRLAGAHAADGRGLFGYR